MSYFDDASLVMIPSGYKTSKVYSVKPTDGSGDLTFTRSNDTATRVGPDGLIEKVRTNLITYSNDVSNAAWAKITNGTYTITSETITDPFGNSVAVKKVTLTSGGYLVLRNTLGSATTSPTTGSVYIKKTVSTTAVDTDLSDGGVAVSANNTNWQRLVSINPASVYGSGTFIDINITTVNEPVYVAYAQIELSDFGATPYIATTSAAVSVGPVANVPRLDYLGSSCPRLLLEGQRQNELQYSEQANNAYWTLFGATISANTTATLDPAGYYGADKLQEDTSTAAHTYGVSISGGSTTKTLSVFAKAAERNWAALRLYNGSSSFFAYFNLSTGALGSVTAGATSAITSYGNGWYRCSITLALGAGSCEPNIFASTGNGTINYQGVTGSGIYVYGAQLEAGAYATSYIPTLGAAVTRSSDVCNKTSVASLIGQTEGTLFAEVSFDDISGGGASASGYFYITDGSFANAVIVGREPASPNSKFFFFIQASGVGVLNNTTNNITSGLVKMALAYKSGDWAAYLNGNLVASGSTTFAFNASMSRIGIGTNDGAMTVTGTTTRAAQALLFKTRLSNSDLAALTA